VADTLTAVERSRLMSRIRSRGNARTEVALAKLLRRHGVTGWRRHLKLESVTAVQSRRFADRRSRYVRPDFVFRKERVVVFVDGCFWHGCPLHATQPKDNRAFWWNKIRTNRARDRRVHRALRAKGWKVLRIWEHALRGVDGKRPIADDEVPSVIRRIRRALGTRAQ
jgi:DNA mismatch endonuclease (patch repair protein)